MGTQWFVGPGGPAGFRYEALQEVWRRTKTPVRDRDSIFDDLRIMEAAAMEAMTEK